MEGVVVVGNGAGAARMNLSRCEDGEDGEEGEDGEDVDDDVCCGGLSCAPRLCGERRERVEHLVNMGSFHDSEVCVLKPLGRHS